ncbi:lipopolysaccharide biosynthesis protein [Polaribacter sp. 20A6]|uniref:lipopolysaccharide biosynthesis protein n=1 Tax=Polaribacter sp. 20A6 TaxID=2687289 RepID=UPI00197BC0FA|nr:lipopolysaccharide biosynthesis protein [Polaribacter sp. 20A6]
MSSKSIFTGVLWTSIQFIIDIIFRFAVRFMLAKLLLPSQFGLVGMCTVFIAVAGAASELGMSAVLIQKKNDKDAEEMYPTAFWSGLIWGVVIYCILSLVITPLAASFYDEPKLKILIPVLSLGILLKPFNLIHTVILTRSMDFKSLAKILNTSSIIAGVVSLISAYFFNFGVWALVLNNVLAVVISVPFLFYITKWKPVLEWSKEHFKNIFGFGAYSSGTLIFSTLTYNIDNLMIGKMLGASLLGSYTLSFSLTEQIRQAISGILNKVMYPVFGKNQDDRVKLKNYFLKIVNLNSIAIYPLMSFIFLFATEIINFFGERWLDAVIPLKIMCIAMMTHLLVNSFTSLIRGLGKPGLEMKIIISLTLFVLIPGLYFGISNYGLIGAAFAILLNKIALVIVGVSVLKNEINLSIKELFFSIKGAIVSIILATTIFLLVKNFIYDNVFFLMILFVTTYLLAVFILEKKNLNLLLSKLK